MLANSRAPWQLQIPVTIRLCVVAVFLAGIAYYALFAGGGSEPTTTSEPDIEVRVVVPDVDNRILERARDSTRQERLTIDAEPLRHLLEKAIDVSPAAALALGRPRAPVPLAEVRADPAKWRGKWLWYKGELEQPISGPRAGHPVEGRSIYEATVRLPDGNRVIATYSLNDESIRRGEIVRVEGYFMKLRDTTYPSDINDAPFLVGREIQRDYVDWPAVTEIDPTVFEGIDDTDPFPGAKIWHEIEEDQDVPLWHLAAYAREYAKDKTLEDWRQHPVLNFADTHNRLVDGKIARGTPMRILGSLVKRRSIAAPANPAGIDYWTVAYVQSQDYAGIVIPVWVPKHVGELPLRTDLEIRGHYYRWFAYTSLDNTKRRTHLFVAADLDRYDLEAGKTMQGIGIVIGSLLLLLMVAIFFTQRRMKTASERHAADMAARRRRRAEREAAAGGTATEDAPPATS
ncbi:MAG: hypothetical protein NXI31_15460 [bacterium]|nr:hypothetical protein [bacterium]